MGFTSSLKSGQGGDMDHMMELVRGRLGGIKTLITGRIECRSDIGNLE